MLTNKYSQRRTLLKSEDSTTLLYTMSCRCVGGKREAILEMECQYCPRQRMSEDGSTVAHNLTIYIPSDV